MQITIQQSEQECGLYVLKALGEHFHNVKIDINKLRLETEISAKGISVYNLKILAKQIGIKLEPFQAPAYEILKNQNEYFIVGIQNSNFNHYVIIEVKKDYVNVFDPARGNYKLLFSEFSNVYSGLIFTIEAKQKPNKIKAVKTKKKQEQILSFVFRKTNLILMSTILIIILLALTFVSTFFMKIVFDKIIPAQAINLLGLIAIFFLAIAIVRVLTNYLKQLFIKKLALELELILYQKYKEKLAFADFKTISTFQKSDLLRRMLLIESCSVFLSTSIFVIIEEGITLSVALAILIYISPQFFAIVLASGLFTVFLAIIFHFIIHPLYKDIFQKAIKNFSFQNIRINELTSLKNKDYKLFSDDHLVNSFYEMKAKEYKLWKIISFKAIIEEMASSLVPIIITYIFVKEIFTYNVKPGQMLLFLAVSNFFISPVHSITDYLLKLKQNLINWNYLQEILNLKNEPANKHGMKLGEIKKLVLENIAFKYKKPVLKIKRLVLMNSIRITSNNGTGKSTLLKLIALCFLPEFNYKINNIDYSYYSLESIRDQIFFLEGNHYLPSTRVHSFITLNDSDQITMFESNLKKYDLNNFLNKNGIFLNDFLKEGGLNLSSGQKQIIALLRLFSKKYQMIVLDEAIENISISNLDFLRNAICDFQNSAIFIEVSHTKRYLKAREEIYLEAINQI